MTDEEYYSQFTEHQRKQDVRRMALLEAWNRATAAGPRVSSRTYYELLEEAEEAAREYAGSLSDTVEFMNLHANLRG